MESNLKKIFAIGFSWMFIVIMPIIVPFFESLGLNMHQVFQLQAVFAFSVLVLEVPSGYFSDLMGRKKTLILASVFHGLGFLILPLSQNFTHLIIAEVILAAGISLFSGTDVALMYDSIEAMSKEDKEKSGEKYIEGMNQVADYLFYKQMGESLASVVCAGLLLIHPKMPIWVQVVSCWLPLFVAFTVVEPERNLMDKSKHGQNFAHIFSNLFKAGPLLRYILFSSMFYGVATLVAVWTFQKIWSEAGITLAWFGALWALSNLTVGLTGKFAPWVKEKLGMSRSLIIMGVLPIFAYLGVAHISIPILLVAACFLFQVARGLNQVLIRDALNRRVSGEMRATANSITSLGVRTLFIALGPAMGFLMDKQGIPTAFSLYAAFYVIVLVFILLPTIKYLAQDDVPLAAENN